MAAKQPSSNQTASQATTGEKTPAAPILIQIGIYATILFISWLISEFFAKTFPKFPLPTPVIGLVLLYLALTLKIVKVEWVDSFGGFMISLIGFLFVPSGIQLAGTLGILQHEGWKLIVVIILSTVILLVVVAYTTRLFIWIRVHLFHGDAEVDAKNKQ
ncbi:CidA/LrgA family protein [Furfurilactobacillus curtus]|uniref:Murein hydrolase transporter LrgA n=1 Tax=Furfurilactobacillus curtus TaxID=1746200 RepID=A0ABQ5JNR2_9LACO